MTDSNTLAQAITAAHAAGFTGFPPQLVPAPASDAPVYLGALQACSTLGFIAHDAQVLAHAWQSRWQRTGSTTPAIWPTVAQDFGLQARPHAAPFAACPQQLGLYAVLPDAAWVGRMARAGVPTVQLRFKSDDPQVQELRQSGLRLGVSTHGYAEMLRADAVQPSYIALGAVFPTTLKRMATVPQGMARLAAYVALLRDYPTVAIGGIGQEQFAGVLATGVGSIAVVRALVNAPDPKAAAVQLLQAMQSL